MTTVHPTPAPSPPGRKGLAQAASRASQARSTLFFEPTADRVSRHAEGARQPAQTAAFVIGAKDALALLRGVAIDLRLVAARAPTRGAQIALFAIVGLSHYGRVGCYRSDNMSVEPCERVYLLSSD